jgi:hypothetical protein
MRQKPDFARLAGLSWLGFALLVLGAMMAGAPFAAAAGGTSVTIEPATRSVQPGESFQVDIVVDTSTPTRGIQFGMTYDPKLVQIDQVLPGPFYQAWSDTHGAQGAAVLPFQPQNGNGRLGVGAIVLLGGPEDGPTGRGAVMSIRMTAREGAAGRLSLLLTDVIVSSAQAESIPDVTWRGGVIGVGLAPEAIGPPLTPLMASPDTPTVRTRPAPGGIAAVLAPLAALPALNFFIAGLLAGCAGTVTGLYLLRQLRIKAANVPTRTGAYASEP